MEVCWLLSTKCNLDCKFCHLFYFQNNQHFIERSVLINNIKDSGITEITLSGGEPFLYPDVYEAIKELYHNNIGITVISNGTVWFDPSICKYIEELVFSLDTIDDSVNEYNGRGRLQRNSVVEAINSARCSNPSIELRINTMVGKNTTALDDVAQFLDSVQINKWRLFKFIPIRGKALENQTQYTISDNEFLTLCDEIQSRYSHINIQTRINNDFENEYLIVLPNGDIVRTMHGKDYILGNVRSDSIKHFINI